MYPFFFGQSEEQLYGVLHQSGRAGPNEKGAVLAAPAGVESSNSRRSFRALASQLARRGCHALRFDYFGTGDSAGDADQGSPGRWTADIEAAVCELEGSRGLKTVSLIGLRLGATLAAMAAVGRDDIDAIAMWAPIVDGAAYLASLRALQRAWVAHEDVLRPGAGRHATEGEVLGYPLPPTMIAELERIDLLELKAPPASHILVLNCEEANHYDDLVAHLRSLGAIVDRLSIPEGRIWYRELGLDRPAVPRQAIDGVAEWIAGETP